jgi:hypothetical protein
VHVLDEDQLVAAEIDDGNLQIGRATYGTLLLPSMSVISEESLRRLKALQRQGVAIHSFGDLPTRSQGKRDMVPVHDFAANPVRDSDWAGWCRKNLPRLLAVDANDVRSLRASAWTSGGATTRLLMNLSDTAQNVSIGEHAFDLAGGQLVSLRESRDGEWKVEHSFVPASVPANEPEPAGLELTRWQSRFDDDGPWRELDRPMAAYQLGVRAPNGTVPLNFPITGPAHLDGQPLAKSLEYRATLQVTGDAAKVHLLLEPTAQRGRFTISLNGNSWSATISDIGTQITSLDISSSLEPGDNEIHFRVHEPMSLDGIKWPPRIETKP